MVLYLLRKYPNYNIINFDKMDYCSSVYYFKEAESLPNYSFVKVRTHPIPPSDDQNCAVEALQDEFTVQPYSDLHFLPRATSSQLIWCNMS